jgi:uncharacterized protein YndB with AHSA1/START domain
MAAANSAAEQLNERELFIERIFDAPRSLVWKAWAEPERMVKWLGPRGFTGSIIRMDSWVGGSYRFQMRSPDGNDHWAQGVYREVVEGERLVYTWAWGDANGRPTTPETVVTVNFSDAGNKTKITLHQALFESVPARDEHRFGWSSAFDCLADYLASVA